MLDDNIWRGARLSEEDRARTIETGSPRCIAHSSRGGSICSNGDTISEKKITEVVVEALHDVLTTPDVLDAFKRAFERRVSERAVADPPVDLEQHRHGRSGPAHAAMAQCVSPITVAIVLR